MSDVVTPAVVEAAPVETATPVADPVTPVVEGAPVVPVPFKQIVLDSQDAADDFIKDRIARATRSAEKKAEAEKKILQDRITGFETAQLTEDQKKEQRAITAEKLAQERGDELTKLQREILVRDNAGDLPKSLWDRVRGETEEEIVADIASLMEGVPAAPVVPGRPPAQSPMVRVQPVGTDPDPGLSVDDIMKQLDERRGRSY